MSGKRMMKTSKKPAALILSLALILTAVLGATAAYLTTRSSGITNTFTPAAVTCEVDETLNGADKVIKVKNTGDADAYIRVALVATWQDSSGTVYIKAPKEGTDYTVSHGTGWVKGSDGYYYHQADVDVGATTETAITVVKGSTSAPTTDYSLHVEVLAEAVQVVQGNAKQGAIYAWGVDPATGAAAK